MACLCILSAACICRNLKFKGHSHLLNYGHDHEIMGEFIFYMSFMPEYDSYTCWAGLSFTHAFIYSLTHSFIHSFIHSFTNSFTHSLIHSFIHSFTPSFLHSHISPVYCELGSPLPVGLQVTSGRSRYVVGSSARFSCSSSHVLIGDRRLLCMQDGKWDSPLPHCISKRIY